MSEMANPRTLEAMCTRGDLHCYSKLQLQTELRAQSRRHCVDGLPEAGRVEQARRCAEIGAIEQIEKIGAQQQSSLRVEPERFADGQINFGQPAAAKSVATDAPVLPRSGEKAEWIIGCQNQRLSTIAR